MRRVIWAFFIVIAIVEVSHTYTLIGRTPIRREDCEECSIGFSLKAWDLSPSNRLGPTAQGLENIPHEGGAIIAANHLAVIDDALLPVDLPAHDSFHGQGRIFRRQRHQRQIQEMVVHVSRRVPRGSFRRFQITWRTEPRP